MTIPTNEELNAVIRKQAAALAEQRRLTQNILHTIPLGLIAFDKEPRIQLSNQLAQTFLGYTARELKDQKLDFVFPELRKLDLAASPITAMARKKDGELFPVEMYLNQWEDELVFAHLLDITERHRLEKLREDFLAMVSHDLRSPLSSVRLYLQMIGRGTYGETTPQMDKATSRAETSVELMVSLVNDLLDSEQLQTGNFQLEFSATSTREVVEKAVNACLGSAQAANVELAADFTNDSFNADEDRVVRVIVNLISNAIKFSPAGATVLVTAGLDGAQIVFRVIDQGPGIPEHLQQAIFERYRQLDQPKETKRRGVGLGLSICRALVDKHKGEIWVESEVGKGSKFCFSIPLVD